MRAKSNNCSLSSKLATKFAYPHIPTSPRPHVSIPAWLLKGKPRTLGPKLKKQHCLGKSECCAASLHIVASREKNVIWTITVNHRNPNGKRKYLQINAGKRQLRQLRRSKTEINAFWNSAFILIHMRVSKAKPRYFLPEHSKLVSGKHIGCMTSSAQKWSGSPYETAGHPCLSELCSFFYTEDIMASHCTNDV